MTITIPAGTTLYRADDDVPMYVADDSTGEIVDADIFTATYTIRFEDGEEYTICWELLPGIYENPGNNVTHVNGADVTGHGARRRIS